MTNIIDEEWENFILNNYKDRIEDSDDNTCEKKNNNCQNNINDNENLNNETIIQYDNNKKKINYKDSSVISDNIPDASDIYISTKSKIAYLKEPVPLNIFWEIPVIPYTTPSSGVIKKQIKINSSSQEEIDYIQSKLEKEIYYEQQIMTSINNPSGRIKFKDIRKITVGISKKDIMSYRSKKKQAFYNCFVMIIRIKIQNLFKEFHIKVFNTGKLEIPGVQNDEIFEIVLNTILYILQPYSDTVLSYKQTSDTVLINSNFNCGFYIDREVLYDILKYKYNIQSIYDPCSYPGIQCKFYYDDNMEIQTGIQNTKEKSQPNEKIKIKNKNKEKDVNITEVSFMIFRTGSVLIVGMCNDLILMKIYEFLKNLLRTEFTNICQKVITDDMISVKNNKRKIRKKIIHLSIESTLEL
jgi:hypothetical protein